MNQSKKKKPSLSSLKKKADILWAVLVKIRAGNKCEICGKEAKEVRLNSHHIIGRKYLPFRHDPRNGACLCASHHKFAPDRSAHENPVWFFEWLGKNRSKDLKFLQRNYESALKVDYNVAIKNLQKEIDSLTRK